MEKIILTIKDSRKKTFFLKLLSELDFVEVQTAKPKKPEAYDFFASAGLWNNRDIDAKQLRAHAWKRKA